MHLRPAVDLDFGFDLDRNVEWQLCHCRSPPLPRSHACAMVLDRPPDSCSKWLANETNRTVAERYERVKFGVVGSQYHSREATGEREAEAIRQGERMATFECRGVFLIGRIVVIADNDTDIQ